MHHRASLDKAGKGRTSYPRLIFKFILLLVINKIRMGTKQSTEIECEDWRETEWEGVGEKERNFGRWRTLRNRRTGAMVDEYQLSWLSEHEYNFYLKSFNWRNRRKNQSPIVNSIFLKEICRGEVCSGKYAANVYLEHISLRLSQIEEIPLNDSLFILVESLEGFSQLYQHSGYFKIHEEQIGFDRSGKVKVWVNSDLSKNYPECDAECGHRQKDEIDMVEQLISIINTATDEEEMPHPNIQEYFDMVRKREVMQIGFEYAKIVAMEYARMNQVRLSSRFDAVVDLFASPPLMHKNNYQSTNQMSTLPSSQTIPLPPYQQPYQPRLNNSSSMPNINTFPHNYSTMSYQPPPQPYYNNPRPQTYNNSNYYNPPPVERQPQQINEIPRIPRLSEINYSQFGEPSIQTKRKSRNSKTSKNSKSQMVGIEETTQNQSLHFNQSHADERNTMKSMPLRNPYSTHRDRFGNNQRIRYSQCDEEIFSQNDFQQRKPFNHDAFGVVTPANRRMMKESNSSYRIGSSNSSQSRNYRRSNKHEKHSKNSGSSRRESVINDRYYQRRDKHYPLEVVRPELRYGNLTEEWELDPEIEADIKRYLG